MPTGRGTLPPGGTITVAYKFGGTEALKNSLVLGMTTVGAG